LKGSRPTLETKIRVDQWRNRELGREVPSPGRTSWYPVTATGPRLGPTARRKRKARWSRRTHRASSWRHGGESASAETATPALADPAGALCRPTLRPVCAVSESTGEPDPRSGTHDGV